MIFESGTYKLIQYANLRGTLLIAKLLTASFVILLFLYDCSAAVFHPALLQHGLEACNAIHRSLV